MAKQTVGIGSAANDGTGDTLRAGADKINDNFDEIYNALGTGTTLTDIINTSGLIDVSSGANKIDFITIFNDGTDKLASLNVDYA